MSTEVKVPTLPESVSDAIVAKWHKQIGDSIRRDENLVDLETDKVVLEVPSPVDGTLESISAEEGETVTAEQLLGSIKEGAVAETESKPEEDSDENRSDKTNETADSRSGQVAASKDRPRGSEHDTSKLAPAVRKMVTEKQLDPKSIQGTGRAGRITKGDVIRHIGGGGERPEERVKLSRLRQRIAERMKEAQNTAAILTSFNEVDLKAVMDLRARYKEDFHKAHGVKLGFMSFFVKACCEALDKHPVVNASVEGDEIIYHGYQDVGIAVSTDRGLMVPILRNAGQMNLAQIETQIMDYAEQARAGKIELEDLQGGTFSITNGGVFGSLLSTPLLNPPQSAILGMHTIKERPVVVHGEIVVRPMMYIALSYDHRIIDGKDAVQFLIAVKASLEDPARMLLGL